MKEVVVERDRETEQLDSWITLFREYGTFDPINQGEERCEMPFVSPTLSSHGANTNMAISKMLLKGGNRINSFRYQWRKRIPPLE